MTKKGRKILTVTLISLIAILVVLFFSLNIILGGILRHAINNQVEAMSKTSNKEIDVGKINLNFFSRTLILRDISILPDSILFAKLKQGKHDKVGVFELKISALRFQGLGIMKLFKERQFFLKKILVEGAELTIYKNEYNAELTEDNSASQPISVDSIYIKGLNGINLSKMIVNEYSYTTVDASSNDTILSFSGIDFEIKGLALESYGTAEGFFRFNADNLSLKMRRQRIDLKGKNYFVFLKKLEFSYSDNLITAADLQVKPTRNKYKLGASFKYTKEVFDVEVKLISVFGYNIDKTIRQGLISIDSILIDGLNLDLYKDRNRPFDLNKRPLFIQEQLKQLKLPLHISKIKVQNSKFIYSMRPEGSEKLLFVDISNIDANMDFVTSLKDSLRSGKKLRLSLSGQLMGTADLNLNVIMPYNSPVDTFYFSGTLGSANFTKFNPAFYPATGIKFNGGKLNSMKFYANASPKSSKGLMTMLYEDLEAEVPQKDVKKKNKFLSFGANAVLRTSNPNKKGKTRVALIKFNRVEYKGFGNLLWKSVQTGLVNTILPTGKSYKEESGKRSQESGIRSQEKGTRSQDEKTSSKEQKKRRRKQK